MVRVDAAVLDAVRPGTPAVHLWHTPPPGLTTLCVCVASLFVPLVLPRAWFRPRGFERGPLHRLMGVRLFRRLAPDGDFVNANIEARRAVISCDRHAAGPARASEGDLHERACAPRAVSPRRLDPDFAPTTGQFVWAALLTAGNVGVSISTPCCTSAPSAPARGGPWGWRQMLDDVEHRCRTLPTRN